MPEEAPIFQFSASLRVRDAAGWHVRIEKETGITPSSSHLRGEFVHPNSRFKRRWGHDSWILSSPLDKERSLSEHLNWLWEEIFPHVEFFKKMIIEGVHVDIFCGYRSDSDTAGFSLNPRSLVILQELQVPLEVSVIIHSMEEGRDE